MNQETEDAKRRAVDSAAKSATPTGMDKIRKELAKKAGLFKRVFLTADGEQVMKILEDAFDGDTIFNVDPHKTAYNLGHRDVVMYIKQMIKFEVD